MERVVTKQFDKHLCTRSCEITLEGGVVKKVKLTGGCPGQSELIRQLFENGAIFPWYKDIECKDRGTSCIAEVAWMVEELK